jgi:hypothetical protein
MHVLLASARRSAAVIGVGASKHWHDGGAEPPVYRVGCRVDRP